jgi:acetyl-CoA carboxylase/biotin carboxylase 1
VGAATVEFLYLVEERRYCFLELNPRLQVWGGVKRGRSSGPLLPIRCFVIEGLTCPPLFQVEHPVIEGLTCPPLFQVEHPVTEGITGVNIPSCQLLIGMGVPLWRIPAIRALHCMDPKGMERFDLEEAGQKVGGEGIGPGSSS